MHKHDLNRTIGYAKMCLRLSLGREMPSVDEVTEFLVANSKKDRRRFFT